MPPNHWAQVLSVLKPEHPEPVLSTREAAAMRTPRTAAQSSPWLAPTRENPQQQRPGTAINKDLNVQNTVSFLRVYKGSMYTYMLPVQTAAQEGYTVNQYE